MPVFVLDPRLLDGGRFPSANRAWFLLESLRELRGALRERGGELFVRAGRPEAGAAGARARDRRRGGPLRLRRVAVRDGARPARRGGDRGAPASGQLRRRRRRAADVERRPVQRLQPVPAPLGGAAAPRRARRAARAQRSRRTSTRARSRRAAARGRGAVRARRGRGARAAAPLARERDRALPRAPRPARGRHVAALALPPLRLRLRARGRGARPRQGRRGRGGVRAPARLARLLRARAPAPPGQRAPRAPAPLRGARVGRRPGGGGGLARRAAPASRSSTPACASSRTRAGCTTARG